MHLRSTEVGWARLSGTKLNDGVRPDADSRFGRMLRHSVFELHVGFKWRLSQYWAKKLRWMAVRRRAERLASYKSAAAQGTGRGEPPRAAHPNKKPSRFRSRTTSKRGARTLSSVGFLRHTETARYSQFTALGSLSQTLLLVAFLDMREFRKLTVGASLLGGRTWLSELWYTQLFAAGSSGLSKLD